MNTTTVPEVCQVPSVGSLAALLRNWGLFECRFYNDAAPTVLRARMGGGIDGDAMRPFWVDVQDTEISGVFLGGVRTRGGDQALEFNRIRGCMNGATFSPGFARASRPGAIDVPALRAGGSENEMRRGRISLFEVSGLEHACHVYPSPSIPPAEPHSTGGGGLSD